MLDFGSSKEEERCLDLFDLCQHARELNLPADEETFGRVLAALCLDELGCWVYDVNPSVDAPYHGLTTRC